MLAVRRQGLQALLANLEEQVALLQRMVAHASGTNEALRAVQIRRATGVQLGADPIGTFERAWSGAAHDDAKKVSTQVPGTKLVPVQRDRGDPPSCAGESRGTPRDLVRAPGRRNAESLHGDRALVLQSRVSDVPLAHLEGERQLARHFGSRPSHLLDGEVQVAPLAARLVERELLDAEILFRDAYGAPDSGEMRREERHLARRESVAHSSSTRRPATTSR